MLVRKCGLDAIKGVMPEEHMKLLTNIRKVGCKLGVRLKNIKAYAEQKERLRMLLFLLTNGFGMPDKRTERKET